MAWPKRGLFMLRVHQTTPSSTEWERERKRTGALICRNVYKNAMGSHSILLSPINGLENGRKN